MVYMDVWAIFDVQEIESESDCKPFGIRQYASALCPGHVFLAPKQQENHDLDRVSCSQAANKHDFVAQNMNMCSPQHNACRMEAAVVRKQRKAGRVASVKQCLVDSWVKHASNHQRLPEKLLINCQTVQKLHGNQHCAALLLA